MEKTVQSYAADKLKRKRRADVERRLSIFCNSSCLVSLSLPCQALIFCFSHPVQ